MECPQKKAPMRPKATAVPRAGEMGEMDKLPNGEIGRSTLDVAISSGGFCLRVYMVYHVESEQTDAEQELVV
jgi:hypothetical protein